MILRKIIKTVATRCHILRLKCTKFDFGWGSAPERARDPPGPLAGLRGPTSKGREGRGGKEREGREGKGEGRERGKGKGRGMEREGGSLYNWKPPPPERNPGYATVLFTVDMNFSGVGQISCSLNIILLLKKSMFDTPDETA